MRKANAASSTHVSARLCCACSFLEKVSSVKTRSTKAYLPAVLRPGLRGPAGSKHSQAALPPVTVSFIGVIRSIWQAGGSAPQTKTELTPVCRPVFLSALLAGDLCVLYPFKKTRSTRQVCTLRHQPNLEYASGAMMDTFRIYATP